jgi:Permease for cytosine/purines, uracil, thiamine, allantoin
VQTYLASASLDIVLLKLFPGTAPYADADRYGFLGLSLMGYCTYALLWVVQALVFWRGMEAIRKFIDFCGPAVYVVMFLLCGYLLVKADWSIDLNLSDKQLTGWATVGTMCSATALVVSYFSGPMLNFGDFSRYSKSFSSVKTGNFWGLPVNFVMFSLLTVLTAAATVPVFGELITDPVETVSRIDNTFAIILGALTFTIATVGINIVANFISPAFDFSHVSPQKISWRMGGMIAAVGSVLLTPWNWYSNDTAIHYTLGILGALIGPLFGILIADYYLIRRQHVDVDSLFSMDESGQYWYDRGYNPRHRAVGERLQLVHRVRPRLRGVLPARDGIQRRRQRRPQGRGPVRGRRRLRDRSAPGTVRPSPHKEAQPHADPGDQPEHHRDDDRADRGERPGRGRPGRHRPGGQPDVRSALDLEPLRRGAQRPRPAARDRARRGRGRRRVRRGVLRGPRARGGP